MSRGEFIIPKEEFDLKIQRYYYDKKQSDELCRAVFVIDCDYNVNCEDENQIKR